MPNVSGAVTSAESEFKILVIGFAYKRDIGLAASCLTASLRVVTSALRGKTVRHSRRNCPNIDQNLIIETVSVSPEI